MAKFNNKQGGDDTDEGAWLVSYADMMTLIACFFILMTSFANYDPVGFQKKMESVKKHFNKGKYKPSPTKFTQIQEEVVSHPNLKNMTKVSVKDNSLVVSFSGTALFPDSGYKLNESIIEVLDSMIDIIKTKDPNFRILIEGHTDNRPIKLKQKDLSSNWALSTARASSIIERFEYYGFEPQNLVAIGYGDTRPLVPNTDKEGNQILENNILNRRVEIKVLQPLDKGKQRKIGLGVFFKDSTVELTPESDFDN